MSRAGPLLVALPIREGTDLNLLVSKTFGGAMRELCEPFRESPRTEVVIGGCGSRDPERVG